MPISPGALLENRAAINKLTAWLPDLVSLLLLLALAYTLAKLSWQFVAPEEAGDSVAPVVSQATRKPPQMQVSEVTRAHLFGKETGPATAPTQTAAPVSRLNLTLRGVLATDPPELSTAIISAGKGPGGKEDIYGIGDTIQSGVKLHEVHNDHVIINRQGKFEKLVMVRDKGVDLGVTSPSLQSGRAQQPTSLGDVRREIMKNPTSFGDYALPIVVKQGGKQVGYRLKPQQKGELLSQYGIQPSDIITEINGVKLNAPQNGIQALRRLSSAQTLNLTVKRGNSFVPINIQLQ